MNTQTPDILPLAQTGAGFLLGPADPEAVYTPEDRTTEEQQMADTAGRFMEKEVLPRTEALENKEEGLTRRLFAQAGELGLLGIETPEEYGGLGLGKRASLGVAEKLGRLGGFGLTCSVHSGIATSALLFFGSEDQKRRYLPKLASGEWMASFCLSETGSGSDALALKTKAVLSPDRKHYILNGTKMWITNAGWADLFTVYAKVDGKDVTAFLVERTFPGVSTGKEEHKLGLNSSSTRRVILEDVPVPVENVLGAIGMGAHLAFNTLNLGRHNFGLGAIAMAQEQLRVAVKYANERRQFGKPLSAFGLVQRKLADMAVQVYSTESAACRNAGLIDAMMESGRRMDLGGMSVLRGIEEFAIECSIVKMRGAEAAAFVTDESIQVHGGYGFTEEFTPARTWRDSRLSRIGEGTNEINRLLIAATLMRRGERGRFPLKEAIAGALAEPASIELPPPEDSLERAREFLARSKSLVFFLCGAAGPAFWEKSDDDQDIQAAVADVIADIYLGECAVTRALKSRARAGRDTIQSDLALLFVNEASQRMAAAAREVIETAVPEARRPAGRKAAWMYSAWTPMSSIALRRKIARHLSDRGGYSL